MMYQNQMAQGNDVARLEDYLQAFRQRKWLVLSFVLIGLMLSYVYTATAPASYTATSQVRLRPTPVGSVNANPVAPVLEEEQQVLGGDPVAAEVQQSFPTVDRRNLDVKFTPKSNILEVSYTGDSPEEASSIVNAFTTAYANQRNAAATAFYTDQIAATQLLADDATTQITELRKQRQVLVTERTSLSRTTVSEARDARLTDIAAETGEIDSKIGLTNTQLNGYRLSIRNDQADLTGLSGNPPGELLTTALPPTSRDGIPRLLLIAAGTLLGLAFGVITAFFLERLDTTARDEEDVALALGTTVMGGIPTLGFGNRGGSGSLIMLSSGGSARIAAAREAFRRLRSSLQFLNSSSGVSSIIVTSSSPAEGKSLTATNLAIAIAQNGNRVVLVSADLRRPSLEKYLGMEANRPGLAEYLSQTAELNAEKVPGIENLWLIRSGYPPENPGELLNSDRFEQMVKELEREDVEYIIVDTPPVLSTADAVSAARYVDGVIVVVDVERTNTSDLLQVRAELERSGSKLLGAVMNRRKFERSGIFQRDKYAYYKADARRAAGS